VNNPEPSIRINVDPTNPGQFFACCGLLELADRLWPGAEAWFEEGKFIVTCAGTLTELLDKLVMHSPEKVTRIECNGLVVKPIIAPLELALGGNATPTITLDAWTKIQCVKGVPQVIANRPWNFWSGQQTSFGIWCGLREVLASELPELSSETLPRLFDHGVLQKGRFGFDPRPSWTALDAGFSPNEHNMTVESSAAVELLAAVGLQRFRPIVDDDCETFVYATWTHPLGPLVAAAAICGAIPDQRSIAMKGIVVDRGQYSALGRSFPICKGVFDD
jgi:CRISPR-associated protein Csx14